MVLLLRFMDEWEKVHKFIEPIIILYTLSHHQPSKHNKN